MCIKPRFTPGARASATDTPQAAAPHGQRILLVEDHADTLKVLARLLRADGHHVVTACCLQEALRAGRKRKFDLLIADIGLPDGSGNDLMVALRKKHALRGIALSGYGMEADVSGCHRAGFAVHATKPVALARLRSLIVQVLEG